MRRPAVPRWPRLGLLVAAIVCTLGCGQQEIDFAVEGDKQVGRPGETAPANDPPAVPEPVPVPVEEDPAEEDAAEDGPVNENPTEKNPLAGCQQCHVDIEDEYAPSLHFKQKVSCKDCHGPSEGHLADENNEVKPDEVFARKDVDRLCAKCHECSRPTAAESPADRSKVCTDCHGPHDLARVPPFPDTTSQGGDQP